MQRREVLRAGGVAVGAAWAGLVQSFGTSAIFAQAAQSSSQDERKGDMVYRPLGSTGEKVSLVGLGGFHIGKQKDESESIQIIRSAIDAGVTFMDNCWDYHDGGSEVRMGKALRDGYRDKVFLMSKIDGHDKASAAKQIDESLKRLQVDHVDLMQFHEVIRPHDPDVIFGSGGSFEAMMEAKKAGKVRFIGFTGHKDPFIHLRMLEVADEHDFKFDAVQMPLNVMDAHFRSFTDQVLPILVQQGIGVLGMKPLASGAILESKTVSAPECLQYAMSLPTSTVITGIDSMRILQQALDVVRDFKPMNGAEIAALLEKTKEPALSGKYEGFKTSAEFDGTAKHPEWLGLTAG